VTGPEHYREAEQALELATQASPDPEVAALLIAGAQAHATLAAAAATAMSGFSEHGLRREDWSAWDRVCGAGA
jgi:hypothetical protein